MRQGNISRKVNTLEHSEYSIANPDFRIRCNYVPVHGTINTALSQPRQTNILLSLLASEYQNISRRQRNPIEDLNL